MEIRPIRRTNPSDERAAEVISTFGPERAESLEERRVGTKRSVTHGDLHGGNVLVDGENRTALIDVNDIDRRPAVFDCISLELSLLFNIEGPAKGGEWPASEQCSNWADADAFVGQSPFVACVRNWRENAERVCTGERELCAVAYAYLLGQFRYVDTDKERLKALIEVSVPLLTWCGKPDVCHQIISPQSEPSGSGPTAVSPAVGAELPIARKMTLVFQRSIGEN